MASHGLQQNAKGRGSRILPFFNNVLKKGVSPKGAGIKAKDEIGLCNRDMLIYFFKAL